MNDVIKGVIEAKSGDGRAIRVADAWYGVFNADSLEDAFKGDTVEFTFRDSGKYKNIVGKVRLVDRAENTAQRVERGARGEHSAGAAQRVPDVERQAAIIRQNALTNAVAFLSRSPEASVDDVIMTAKAFYYYTSGQNERDAAVAGEAF